MTTEARDPRVQRLVFKLVDAAPDAPPFPDVVTQGVTVRRRGPRSAIVAVIASVLVLGAGLAVVALRPSPADRPSTAPTGSVTVAYVDNRGLVVRSPSGEERVVATGSVSAPRLSPSGHWLAYHDGDALWVVRADGSHQTRLTGTASGGYVPVAYSWSPTSDALAVAFVDVIFVDTFDGNGQSGGTHFSPPVGGVAHTVQSFAWSRDGTTLAIAMERREHTGPGAPTASLWLATGVCRSAAPVECGTPRELKVIPYTPGPDDYPLLVTNFGFDDTRVLFWTDYLGSGSVQMDGLPLRAADVDTGAAADIATTIVRDSWVQPSPDGSQLLVVRSNGRMVTDPREVEVCTAPGACTAIAPARNVQTLDPAWSPDGRRIAFVREDHASFTPPVRNGTIDWTTKYRNRRLWLANADGSDAHEITAAGHGVADPQFAPDGKSIVFVRDARVWQLDLATGRAVALTDSLRPAAACTFDDCLPLVGPYEANNLWSNYYAVKFAAGP